MLCIFHLNVVLNFPMSSLGTERGWVARAKLATYRGYLCFVAWLINVLAAFWLLSPDGALLGLGSV